MTGTLNHYARSAAGLAVSLTVVAALAVALAITAVGDRAQDLWGGAR